MPAEPTVKRAIAFIDGQNVFHAARNAFGYTYRTTTCVGWLKWYVSPKAGRFKAFISTLAYPTDPTMSFGTVSGLTSWPCRGHAEHS